MTTNPWPVAPVNDDATLRRDPEYWLFQIREAFEGLALATSYDFASQEVAEIDLALRPARYRNHV
jgi:hypothetical protein